MERNEISTHEVRIYLALKNATGWMTSKEIAALAKVSDRTARAHASKLVKLGILDQAEVFPGHRYRLSEKPGKSSVGYVQRLEQAQAVFGNALEV